MKFSDEQIEALKTLLIPVAAWLRVNAYPHCRLLLDGSDAELLEGQFSLINLDSPIAALNLPPVDRSSAVKDGWAYSHYRATLSHNGKPFAIVTPDGRNALNHDQAFQLLRALGAVDMARKPKASQNAEFSDLPPE